MPLAGAAMWIATRGLEVEIDSYNEAEITAALQQLVDHIRSRHIQVVGDRDGKPEPIPAHQFFCEIAFLPGASGEKLSSREGLVLRSWAYESDEIWEGGFDDCLADKSKVYWSRLRVERSDVARLWPFDEVRRAEAIALTRTGAPGRPSAMHLIIAEHERRMASGEAMKSVVRESEALAEWLPGKLSLAPRTSRKTIETAIRDRHRAYAGPRK